MLKKPPETWCLLVSFKTFQVILAKAVDLSKGSKVCESVEFLHLGVGKATSDFGRLMLPATSPALLLHSVFEM